ncbi:FABP family protein [Fodinicola feengrottensis]|uniref:Ferric nitrobindin-like protein n=1 Tax=Fodinicola feengrottensis TaxID=435914 RepID=A0ABP4U391_9ACTN
MPRGRLVRAVRGAEALSGGTLTTAEPNPGYPYEETHDLRSGPDLHGDLLGLLPLIGHWRGTGKGGYAGVDDFDFAQEVRFSHDGRAVLAYESRTWIIDPDGVPLRPYSRESGWWRPLGKDDFEVVLTDQDGFSELLVGTVEGTRYEMSSDAVLRSSTARDVVGEHRLYGIVERDLLYAVDQAASDQPLRPYMSGRLVRL